MIFGHSSRSRSRVFALLTAAAYDRLAYNSAALALIHRQTWSVGLTEEYRYWVQKRQVI